MEDAQETSADALRLWVLAKGREKSSSEWEVGRANGGTGGTLGAFRGAVERLQDAWKSLSERGSVGGGGRGGGAPKMESFLERALIGGCAVVSARDKGLAVIARECGTPVERWVSEEP